MRIAWLSPMPPLASGIGEYSLQLLPFIAAGADVTVVAPRPGRFRRPQVPDGVAWESPRDWRSERYDATFYHLGNNAFHRYAYEAALAHPGIAVFHDFVLHHLVAEVLVERGHDPVRYEEVLRSEHGELGSRLAELRLRGVASDFEKFLFPLFAHVANRSRAIAVHSEEMRDRMADRVRDVPISVIPHFAPPAPPEVKGEDRETHRRALGLPVDAFIVGFLGYVTLPKQPASVIAGFARLAERFPDALLVMVGRDHTMGRLQRWVSEGGLAGRVRVTGFVNLIGFYRYLLAVDAVVNLRYPTVVESSGTNARALVEGRSLIVSNVGAFAELPDDAVCKVEVDEDQGEAVGRHLIHLAEDPAFRAAVERRGREYATTVLAPARCASLYLRVADEVAEARRVARGRGATASRADPR